MIEGKPLEKRAFPENLRWFADPDNLSAFRRQSDTATLVHSLDELRIKISKRKGSVFIEQLQWKKVADRCDAVCALLYFWDRVVALGPGPAECWRIDKRFDWLAGELIVQPYRETGFITFHPV